MNSVQSLERGLDILKIVNESGGSRIRDLQVLCDLPKPTIVRLLKTLVATGYVKRHSSGEYCVGAKVLALSNRYEARADLVEAAKPVMAQLRGEQTWPVDLAVFRSRRHGYRRH